MRIVHPLTGCRETVVASAVLTMALTVPVLAAAGSSPQSTPLPSGTFSARFEAPAPSAVHEVTTLAQVAQTGEEKALRRGRDAKETRQPRRSAQPGVAPKAAAVPAGCATATGVERRICIECDAEPTFKRIACQQRVFWSVCKGKRLFSDRYCRTNQESQGALRGEGN